MGLESDSAIFEALANLEQLGFIRRRRMRLPNRTSQVTRNVYQRPAPEFTLLELLNRGRVASGGRPGDIGIDALLNPVRCPAPLPGDPGAITAIPKGVQAGMKRLLGGGYGAYAYATDGERHAALIELLEEGLAKRRREGGEKYAKREPAPRDRQRQKASEREKAIAAMGGVATRQSDTAADEPLLEEEIPF
jgi:hypothetical protein